MEREANPLEGVGGRVSQARIPWEHGGADQEPVQPGKHQDPL